MKRGKAGYLVMLTIVLAATVACRAEEARKLEMEWRTGRKYFMRMDMTQTTKTEVPQMPDPVENQTVMTLEITMAVVDKAPDGSVELEIKHPSAKLEVEGMGQKLTFDSSLDTQSDIGNPIAPSIRAMTRSTFTCHLNADGTLDRVEGVEEMLEAIKGQAGADAAAAVGGMGESQIENWMKGYTQSDWMPGKPVRPGDTWTHDKTVTLGPMGDLRSKSRFRLSKWAKHRNRDCALIEFTGTVANRPAAEAASGVPKMSFRDLAIKGTTWFDPKLKACLDTQVRQTGDIDMEVPGQDGSIQKITTSFDQNIRVRLTKIGNIKQKRASR